MVAWFGDLGSRLGLLRAGVVSAAMAGFARAGVVIGGVLAFGVSQPVFAQNPGLECPTMAAMQGGGALCKTAPGATVSIDGEPFTTATADGWAFVGFERKAGPSVSITSSADGARPLVIALAEQDYPESRIDRINKAGPPSSYSPKELAHICLSTRLKRAAFAAPSPGLFFLDGFILPAEGRRSGVYGSARIYNGDESRPRVHWGIDVAAPTGTPFVAPAGGVVTLADPNLFFEGGAVFLDHGQGMVSVFMHMSAVDVLPGDVVAQGQVLGKIGSTGRSTGPHLHWGVKVNNAFWVDPALLMQLEPQRASGDASSGGLTPADAQAARMRAIEAYAAGLTSCFEG